MSVRPGARLGVYEITALIGEGGMGSVYRAHDTQLDRDVALKVVRHSLASDPALAARFEREARLLAALNHPHIAAIYGLEQSDGVRFLVLELVQGASLAERLAEGPLRTREALALGVQIASAIEAAHERGIIHRDLKPGNVKIAADGTAKVLDFGIAKALVGDSAPPALAQSPTLTSGGTGEGVILGTAAYMSPEQARGKPVDTRTDVWAFGCLLYDMLAGKPAFSGDTLSDTIAAVLTRDPDWSLLPSGLPANVRRLLRHCLEKDTHRRLRDIGDARLELEDAMAAAGDSGAHAARDVEEHPASDDRRPIVAALVGGALVAGAALGALGLWFLSPAPAPARSIVQFPLLLAASERLAGLDFPAVAFSPAEEHIAYIATRGGQQQLFVRALSSMESTPLQDTEGALSPFFSPDGQWIAFFAGGKLKKVRVGGGGVQVICDAPIGFGGVWSRDGTIIFAPDNGSGLFRVAEGGGTPTPVTRLNTERGEFSHRWPELLPDGQHVLFTIGTEGSWNDAEIALQALDSSDRRVVVHGGTAPRYLRRGYLLYVRSGTIFAQPFDARSGQSRGEAAAVLGPVMQSVDGAAQLATSPDGSAVLIPATAGADQRTLLWADRRGDVQPLAAPPRPLSTPRLSPNGRTIALTIPTGDRDEVWTYDVPSNQLTQFTFGGGSSPAWSVDGTRIVFSSGRAGAANLFWKAADGTGPEERLTTSPRAQVASSASLLAGGLLLVESDPAAGRDILFLQHPEHSTRPWLTGPANESAPAYSPDGKFVAFVSDQSGRSEVYVSPVASPSAAVKVSAGGGGEPVWRRDGTELFFRAGNRMLAAPIRTRPALAAGKPQDLFSGVFDTGEASRPEYDVSLDGMRFLMVRSPDTAQSGRELRVLLDWTGKKLER